MYVKGMSRLPKNVGSIPMPRSTEKWENGCSASFDHVLFMLDKFGIVIQQEYERFRDYATICNLALDHYIVPDNERRHVYIQGESFLDYAHRKLPNGVDIINEITGAEAQRRRQSPNYGDTPETYWSYERQYWQGLAHRRNAGLMVIVPSDFDKLYNKLMLNDGANAKELQAQIDRLRMGAKAWIYMRVFRGHDENRNIVIDKDLMKIALDQLEKLKTLQSHLDKIKEERRQARQAIIYLRTVATRARTATGKPLQLPHELEGLIYDFLQHKNDKKPSSKSKSPPKSASSPTKTKPAKFASKKSS